METYAYIVEDRKGKYQLREREGNDAYQEDVSLGNQWGFKVVKCFVLPEERSKELAEILLSLSRFVEEGQKDLSGLETRVKTIANDVTVLV
ncbi:MAG TPA: hypothetical protein VJB94_03355 [Candidatus Nanoarchaeia archaeon]|nr:hypothetical protein [Candidatus Nanoarchaeia archaeon]